jgi:hypothetical protein
MASSANVSASHTSNSSPASHTFYRREQREFAKLEQNCPGAPLKAGHKGFVAEPEPTLIAENPVTPRTLDNNVEEPVCPGAPLRKRNKGFLPEPDDGF